MTEVANWGVARAESVSIAEIDGQWFAGSASGAFVLEKLKAGVGVCGMAGGFKVIKGQAAMEKGIDAGDINR
jgi:hypothetical protein